MKIEKNVSEFLDKVEILVTPVLVESWSQRIFSEMFGNSVHSPIEQMFYAAALAICEAQGLPLNPCDEEFNGVVLRARGLTLVPQYPVGKYTVDFLLKQENLGPDDIYGPVVVELDGHAFHDRDKHQRAYEKARDRFLVRSGYRVLHYTGSEVVADPFRVADEALSMAGAFIGDRGEDDSYDPSNPLGRAL